MNGYKIIYLDLDGSKHETWFGEPIYNFDISDSLVDIVKFMFIQAHPGCSIISCSPCKFKDFDIAYEKRYD